MSRVKTVQEEFDGFLALCVDHAPEPHTDAYASLRTVFFSGALTGALYPMERVDEITLFLSSPERQMVQ